MGAYSSINQRVVGVPHSSSSMNNDFPLLDGMDMDDDQDDQEPENNSLQMIKKGVLDSNGRHRRRHTSP